MSLQHAFTRRLAIAGAAFAISTLAAGCAPVLIGSAALTTASFATDPRTGNEQLSDTEIELRASNALQTQFSELARITASSYNGVVLLTGDATDDDVRQKAVSLVSRIPGVKSVIDRITVGPRTSFTQITSDTWLSSKIRTTLIATKGIPSGSVEITVESGNVYLQGMVTQQQSEEITRTVRSIDGVKEVFTLFEILRPDQLDRIRGPFGSSTASKNTPPAAVGGGSTTMAEPGPNSPSVAPIVEPSSPQARPL